MSRLDKLSELIIQIKCEGSDEIRDLDDLNNLIEINRIVSSLIKNRMVKVYEMYEYE